MVDIKKLIKKAKAEQDPVGFSAEQQVETNEHLAKIEETVTKMAEMQKDLPKVEEAVMNLPQNKLVTMLMGEMKGEKGDTPVKGTDYFTPEEVSEFKKKVTPVKGVDYFDGKDGKDGRDGNDGKPGKDGRDGKDGKDGKKGEKGEKGEKGDPGKDADPITVIKKLKELPEKEKLDIKDLRNSQQLLTGIGKLAKLDMSDLRWHGGGFSNIYSGGVLVTEGLTGMNFAGSGVTSVVKGADGIVTVTLSGGGGGTPGGSNTQVQFNDSGSFGGDAGLTYNKTTNVLTAGEVDILNQLNPALNHRIYDDAQELHIENQSGNPIFLDNDTTISGDIEIIGTQSITFSGGDGTITGDNMEYNSNGALTIAAGDAPGVDTDGSDVAISAGDGNGTGAGGDVTITAGLAEDGDGGSVVLTAKGGTGSNGSYKFTNVSDQTTLGILNFDNTTADRTYSFPDASGTVALTSDIPATLPITIGGTKSGSPVTTGKIAGYRVVPFAGSITAWDITVDAGTATVVVWKIAAGTTAPTSSDSINTSGVSISSGTNVRSTTLSDFTTTDVDANDIFAFEVTAVSGVSEISFNLEITPD